MTTVTQANRDLPREELRERIYATALRLFRTHGFDKTRIEDVAHEARVAKGTYFNFFLSKGAVLLAYYESLDAKFTEHLERLDPAEPRTALEKFFAAAEKLLRKEGALIDAIFRELASNPALRAADESSGVRDRTALESFFRACRVKGTLNPKVQPSEAAALVSDLWSASVQEWLRRGRDYSLHETLKRKLDALFAGLSPTRRQGRRAGAVMALLACLAGANGHEAHAAVIDPCQGGWIGRLDLRQTPLAFHLRTEKGGCHVTIADIGGSTNAPLSIAQSEYTFSLNGETVEFIPHAVSPNLIDGEARSGSKSGHFELHRLAPDADNRIRALAGLYRFPDGRFAAITHFDEFGDATFFIDYRSGLVGPLLAMADGTISIGRGLMHPLLPEAGYIEVKTPGALVVTEGNTRLEGHAITLRRDSFTVTNGAVRLVGEIVRRTDREPRGTIVLVHGSNDEQRTIFGPWTDYLAARGWAVAVFDKRGSGGSTGDWHQATFADLAGDVRAVADYTRARADLAGRPVGLLGLSQAGWVMPIVAAKPGAIDFVVSLAGPAITPREQSLDAVTAEMRAYKFLESEVAKARDYYALDIDISMRRKPFHALELAYKDARARGAEWLLAPPEPADSPSRVFFRTIADFDVLPYWREVRTPVLAVFGVKDLIVPPEPSRGRLEQVLKQNGNPASRVVVLANIDHVGLIADSGIRAEYPRLTHFDPEYFRTFGDWLDARSASSHK